MQDCDTVLARMQDMLLSSQAHLRISEEVELVGFIVLYEEAHSILSISMRLRNRRAAEEALHSFIDLAILSLKGRSGGVLVLPSAGELSQTLASRPGAPLHHQA